MDTPSGYSNQVRLEMGGSQSGKTGEGTAKISEKKAKLLSLGTFFGSPKDSYGYSSCPQGESLL